jgi:hypothetical protein
LRDPGPFLAERYKSPQNAVGAIATSGNRLKYLRK